MLLQGRSEIISGSNAKAYIECSMSSSRVSFMLNATYPNSLNLKNTELEPTTLANIIMLRFKPNRCS